MYFIYKDQLHEIKKITLAKLICANGDDIDFVQKNVFRGETARYSTRIAIEY
jgi:hypothetical protein